MSIDVQSASVQDVLDAVAAKQPAPGGGAVASLTAALAAATAQMVVSYSCGRRDLSAHHALHTDASCRLQALRERALALAREDAAAFERLQALWKLPKDDPRRRAEWEPAVAAAIAAPRGVLDNAAQQIALMQRLVDASNPLLLSDLAIAAILAEAAARAAAWNVKINLPQMGDEEHAATIGEEIEALVEAVTLGRSEIERGVAERS